MNDRETMESLASDITLADFGPALVVRNWETECASQLFTGQGFRIKKSISFDRRTGKRYIDGIQSPLFGTTWDDEDAFKDRVSCECGKMKGAVYEGEICPECGTMVGYIDVDLNKFGWIVMKNEFKIINPAMFDLIQKYIGKPALDRMLKFDKEMDIDGHYAPNKSKGRDQFNSIGLTGFRKNLFRILEFYRGKRDKKKEAYYWEIIKKWDCIFSSAIPVYSSFIRPISTSGSEYRYTKTEPSYNVIIGCVNKLNAYHTTEIDESNIEDINDLLYKIQEKVNKNNELAFKMLDKKTGHIHDGIFGGRLDFSARDVIVIDPTLRANEIGLSYLAVLELYKLELCNIITKINGVTYDAALKLWFDSHIHFNPLMYETMRYLMNNTKLGMVCLINRNPTIDFGSFDCMHVVKITDSYDNMTMSLPVQILDKLNADFDGDNLNIYSLKTNDLKRKFDKILNPAKSMFISRNDGRIDGQNFLKKDQIIGLHQFCVC